MTLELSAEFVLDQGMVLRGEDLKVGLLAGFIKSSTAVELARARTDVPFDPLIDALSSASPVDEVAVRQAVTFGTEAEADVADPLWPQHSADLWLYLELLALWQLKDSIARPLEMVDTIYAQFDYPEQMASFVSYMPAPPGAETGPDALFNRWEDYLAQEGARLRRDRRPSE